MNPVFTFPYKTPLERYLGTLADVVAHNSRFVRGKEPSYFTYAGHNIHFTHTMLHFASTSDPLHVEIARQTIVLANQDMLKAHAEHRTHVPPAPAPSNSASSI